MYKTTIRIAAAALLVAVSASGGEDVKPAVVGKAFDVATRAEPKLGQMNPTAAFDGKDTYLVVWEEGWPEPEPGLDIRAARVKADGTCLDPEGIAICKAKDFQERPVVAFGGGQWLVVWQDLRNGKDHDIYGSRVSADGKCLDPDGVLLYGGAKNQAQPSVASDGKTFGVVWADYRDGKNYRLFLGRVGADGKPLDGSGIRADAKGMGANPRSINPQIAWTGSGWLVAAVVHPSSDWVNNPYAAAWSADMKTGGNAASLAKFGGWSGVHSLTLATDVGGKGLATWSGNWLGRGGPPPMTAVLLDGQTAKILPHSGEIGLSPACPARHLRASASDGIFLVVAHSQNFTTERQGATPQNAIKAARIRASDGLALEGSGNAARLIELSPGSGNPQGNPAVAGGKGGQFLVVYEVTRGLDNHRIEGRFVQAK